jgi:hypothetical protein
VTVIFPDQIEATAPRSPQSAVITTALDTGTVGNFRLIAFSVNALA